MMKLNNCTIRLEQCVNRMTKAISVFGGLLFLRGNGGGFDDGIKAQSLYR